MRGDPRRHPGPVIAGGLVLGAVVGLVIGLTSSTSGRTRPVHPAAHLAALRHSARGRWIASWTASPEAPGPGTPFAGGFRDQTIRDVIYTSVGGTQARIRLDNTFGSQALVVGRAAIGVVVRGAALAAGSESALTFGGHRSIVVPPGGEVFSDPVRLPVHQLERLAISVFLPRATGGPTEHFEAHQTSYLASGDHALAAGGAAFKASLQSWYFVSGLDVWSSGQVLGAVVALGDSITNGNGTVAGSNSRWPNDLARRLDALQGKTLSVVDAGIEGNRVLNPSPCCGQSALARFDRDVLRQSGVAEVIVLEGINDIGFSHSPSPVTVPHTDVSAPQIIAGYEQLIERAHAAGLKIFGATLTPFEGSHNWTPAGEAKRETINAWIRHSGAFDGVIDFAHAVADRRDPKRLAPRYDDGDHLHPNGAGYRAMANAINLAMLLRGAGLR